MLSADVYLNPDERTVETIRKHWIVPLAHALTALLMFVAPLIVFLIFPNQLFSQLPIAVAVDPIRLAMFIAILWALIVWTLFSVSWLDYYLDTWVITTKQVIDVEQIGLFHRNVATCLLAQIQDVTAISEGFLPTILGYGDIHIQTAGAAKEFVIRSIAHPERVRHIILAAHDRVLRHHQ